MKKGEMTPQENIRKYIRVYLHDENDNTIIYSRNDEYVTTVEDGYEDLDLKEDATKIGIYQTSDYIELYNGKIFKVINRKFMPCCPVCLYLTLKEVENN